MKYIKKLIAKHHKTCLCFASIAKNIAVAGTSGSLTLHALISFMSYLHIKEHLFNNHHLLHIKKHYPHQEIPLNPDKKKYTCKKCQCGYDSIIGLVLHKIRS